VAPLQLVRGSRIDEGEHVDRVDGQVVEPGGTRQFQRAAVRLACLCLGLFAQAILGMRGRSVGSAQFEVMADLHFRTCGMRSGRHLLQQPACGVEVSSQPVGPGDLRANDQRVVTGRIL